MKRGTRNRIHGNLEYKLKVCSSVFDVLHNSTTAICQIVTLGFILKSLHNTGIFPAGTHVSSAFILSQISWGTDISLATFLLAAGIMAARRGDGYRSIPGTPVSRRSQRFADMENEDDD